MLRHPEVAVPRMLAASVVSFAPQDPIRGLKVGLVNRPVPPDSWIQVRVRAAALNHHDLWSLRGVGIRPSALPRVLGSDGAGVLEDGSPVIIHPVLGDPDAGRGDETVDPRRTLLSEAVDGTLAHWVTVPARNVVPKPAGLSFTEAACLSSAYLTAFRMLTTRGGSVVGETVLIQGGGGGVSIAAIQIAAALGLTVWVTDRHGHRRELAESLGASAAFEMGAKLPGSVDLVIESIGQATWEHSLSSLRDGGTVVVTGATSGPNPDSSLDTIIDRQLRIVGSTMGTRDELESLCSLVSSSGLRPKIHDTFPLSRTRRALKSLLAGGVLGKIAIDCS